MEKVKKVFLSCVKGANFDDTILDYIVGLLQGMIYASELSDLRKILLTRIFR